MMFSEVCKLTYQYIMNTETTIMIEFKINPFELFQNISLADFEAYVNGIKERIEAKDKQSDGKGLLSMLKTLRDYLNYMFGG